MRLGHRLVVQKLDSVLLHLEAKQARAEVRNAVKIVWQNIRSWETTESKTTELGQRGDACNSHKTISMQLRPIHSASQVKDLTNWERFNELICKSSDAVRRNLRLNHPSAGRGVRTRTVTREINDVNTFSGRIFASHFASTGSLGFDIFIESFIFIPPSFTGASTDLNHQKTPCRTVGF